MGQVCCAESSGMPNLMQLRVNETNELRRNDRARDRCFVWCTYVSYEEN
jgi:hypothetical protein